MIRVRRMAENIFWIIDKDEEHIEIAFDNYDPNLNVGLFTVLGEHKIEQWAGEDGVLEGPNGEFLCTAGTITYDSVDSLIKGLVK